VRSPRSPWLAIGAVVTDNVCRHSLSESIVVCMYPFFTVAAFNGNAILCLVVALLSLGHVVAVGWVRDGRTQARIRSSQLGVR
jgi:hypothetical protein